MENLKEATMLFWIVTPWRLVGGYQRSEPCTEMPWRCKQYVSKTLVCTYETTRRDNPEQHGHPHRRENLKSYRKEELKL